MCNEEGTVRDQSIIVNPNVFSKSREQRKADARALFCFWAVRELGYTIKEIARRLRMTPPGVGYAVSRGESISKRRNYQLEK